MQRWTGDTADTARRRPRRLTIAAAAPIVSELHAKRQEATEANEEAATLLLSVRRAHPELNARKVASVGFPFGDHAGSLEGPRWRPFWQ
jgi:hypothetical protein